MTGAERGTAPPAAPVEARDLLFDYAGPAGPLRVLDLPAWRVEAGAQVAVAGPSGCGKSTLLHLLSGILRPGGGSLRVCGTALESLAESERDRFRARSVGVVFQSLNLVPGFTARENVLLGGAFHPDGPAGADEADALLAAVGLADRAGHTPDELSLGEQQRVAIARALVKRPALVLADEPTGSLDARNAREVVRLLRAACAERESALVVVTHDPAVLAEFPERVDFAALNRAYAGEAAP